MLPVRSRYNSSGETPTGALTRVVRAGRALPLGDAGNLRFSALRFIAFSGRPRQGRSSAGRRVGSAASLLAGTESCGAGLSRDTSLRRRTGLSRPRSEEACRLGRFCRSSRAHATIDVLGLDVRTSSNALSKRGFTMSILHWCGRPTHAHVCS